MSGTARLITSQDVAISAGGEILRTCGMFIIKVMGFSGRDTLMFYIPFLQGHVGVEFVRNNALKLLTY